MDTLSLMLSVFLKTLVLLCTASPLSSWIIHHYTVVFLKIRIVENLYYSIAIGWITRFDLQGDICWKKWHGSDAELADFQKL